MIDPLLQFPATKEKPTIVGVAEQSSYGFEQLKQSEGPSFGTQQDDGIPVRFSYQTSPKHEVLLHLNSITDRHRENFEDFLMTEVNPGLYQIILVLPEAFTASYRFAAAEKLPRGTGSDRAAWMQVHTLGVPDPMADEVITNPMASNSSVLTMPKTPKHPVWQNINSKELSASDSTLSFSPPRIVALELTDQIRKVTLYPSRAKAKKLLVLFDAESWMSLKLELALANYYDDNLAVVAVHSESLAQREALLTDPEVLKPLLEKLKTEAQSWFGAEFSPEQTIVAGQSYGGLAAAWLLLKTPELVRNGILQSGSYWHPGEAISLSKGRSTSSEGKILSELQKLKLSVDAKAVLQVGNEEKDLHKLSEKFHAELQKQSHPGNLLQVFPGGHDYAWWRHGLFIGLESLTRLAENQAS